MDYLSNKKWIIYTLYFMSRQLLRSFPIFFPPLNVITIATVLLRDSKMTAANSGRKTCQEIDQVNK